MPFDSFRAYRSQAIIRPQVDGPNGRAWHEALGQLHDDGMDAFAQARRARLPSEAPEDALAYIAAERGLERVPGESVEEWRLRLTGAWEIWQRSGTTVGIQAVCDWLGFPNAIVFRRVGHAPPDNAGHNAFVDAFLHNVWSQFDIYLPRPLPWPLPLYDEAVYDVDRYTANAPEGWVQALVRLLRRFRAGHETPALVFFDVTDGSGALYDVGIYDEATYGAEFAACDILVVGEPEWGPLLIPVPTEPPAPPGPEEDDVIRIKVAATVGAGTTYVVPFANTTNPVITATTYSSDGDVIGWSIASYTTTQVVINVSSPFDGELHVYVGSQT